MPHQLSNMDINEISLVGEPANPGANVLLYKNKAGRPASSAVDDTNVVKDLLKGLTELVTKFGVSLEVDTSKVQKEMLGVLGENIQEIATSTKLSKSKKAELIKKSVTEFNEELLKALPLDYNVNPEEDPLMKTDLTKMSAEDKIALAKALQEDADVKKATAEADAEDAADGGADDAMEGKKLKKAKAAVDATEAAITKALEPLQKQLKDAQDIAKALQDKDEDRTRMEKAKELVGAMPGVKVDDVAKMLKGMTAEQVTQLETVTKAANEQARVAKLLEVKGGVVVKEGSAIAIAKGKAAEIMKADTKITSEDVALAKVWEQNPTLYDQHMKEVH